MKKYTLFLTMTLLSLTTSASAHTLFSSAHSGFMAGFAHPWHGADHVLMMFAVGLWAYILGGRALWILPLSFLGVMAAGAGLGYADFHLPYAEIWVSASVLILGLIISFNWRTSVVSAATCVMVFALSHGYLHFAEIPPTAAQGEYMLGFLFSTALLHGLGIAAGLLNAKTEGLLRMNFGYICTAAGLLLLAGY